MKPALFKFVLGVLVLSSAPQADIAVTASASFGVSITVQSSCLASASAMPIEAFAVTPLKAISKVTVTCSHPTPYNVNIGSPGGATTNLKLVESNTVTTGQSGYPPGNGFIFNPNVISITNLRTSDSPFAVDLNSPAQNSFLARRFAARYSTARIYPDEVTVVVTY
ncbi:MAG TPA: hypothetical protein VMU48_04265 [Terracidiphilus sp.]|nr:hypothetical protein [Terracidiphilus sp.]